MAMPANVTTVVVRGTFITPEGAPSTGTITFTPSRWLTNSGADVAIPNSSVTKSLGTAGDFTVTLPVTDDSDLQPANWFYTVSEVVDGVSQSYAILLPGTVATNGTVYLADLAPAGELGPEYASLRGPAGVNASIAVGTVTSVGNAGTAEVTNSGSSVEAILDFVLRDGPTGPQGSAATVTLGTVGFVDYPGPGTVTNSGTSGSAVLDFVLVRGPQGALGDLTGADPIAYVGNEISLKYGAGLGTATGGTLVADFSDATPLALGTAASGTAIELARGDHVHPTDGVVLNALVTAAGQVIASSGSATPVAVAAGSADGQVLTWDTASTPKMKWASPASGSDFHPFFFVGV